MSASAPVVGYFNYGDRVDVISTANPNWYKVEVEGIDGYVSSKYLQPEEDTGAYDDHIANVRNNIIVGGAAFVFIIICLIGITGINKRRKQQEYDSGSTIILKQKSVGLAIILTFLFGPLGMFYSTIRGALIMLALPVISLVMMMLVGQSNKDVLSVLLLGSLIFYLFFYWLICIIWAAIAANRTNKIIINQYSPELNSYEN